MAKLTGVNHLKALALDAKKYVQSLVGDLAESIVEAMEEMDATKSDKGTSVPFSIPRLGWVSDISSDLSDEYPYYCDVSVSRVTANDRASITISPSSQQTAIACGICPTNETLAGKIRIRSRQRPTANIAAEYWIEQGKES